MCVCVSIIVGFFFFSSCNHHALVSYKVPTRYIVQYKSKTVEIHISRKLTSRIASITRKRSLCTKCHFTKLFYLRPRRAHVETHTLVYIVLHYESAHIFSIRDSKLSPLLALFFHANDRLDRFTIAQGGGEGGGGAEAKTDFYF